LARAGPLRPRGTGFFSSQQDVGDTITALLEHGVDDAAGILNGSRRRFSSGAPMMRLIIVTPSRGVWRLSAAQLDLSACEAEMLLIHSELCEEVQAWPGIFLMELTELGLPLVFGVEPREEVGEPFNYVVVSLACHQAGEDEEHRHFTAAVRATQREWRILDDDKVIDAAERGDVAELGDVRVVFYAKS
jgi:hypothetical protein